MEHTHKAEPKEEIIYPRKSLISEEEENEFFMYALLQDLKTPVSYLNSLFESLKAESGVKNSAEFLRKAESAIATMDNTLEKLHNSMNLHKRQEDAGQKASLAGVFEQLSSSELRDELKEAEVTVKFESCDRIHYPEVYLKLIFSHLINNALASKTAERPLHIYVYSQKLGEHVLLTVRDNGKGLKKDEVDNLFKPNSLSRSSEGDKSTQPGLFIIRSLVEKNGGHIVVDSTPNVGTTITLYLKEHNK